MRLGEIEELMEKTTVLDTAHKEFAYIPLLIRAVRELGAVVSAFEADDAYGMTTSLATISPDVLALLVVEEECEHEWADMSNEVISKTAWCPKCGTTGPLALLEGLGDV